VQKSHAQTTPSLSYRSGADLKVKLMLERRSRAGREDNKNLVFISSI